MRWFNDGWWMMTVETEHDLQFLFLAFLAPWRFHAAPSWRFMREVFSRVGILPLLVDFWGEVRAFSALHGKRTL
jgi:hypothetical protein